MLTAYTTQLISVCVKFGLLLDVIKAIVMFTIMTDILYITYIYLYVTWGWFINQLLLLLRSHFPGTNCFQRISSLLRSPQLTRRRGEEGTDPV